MPGLMPAGEPHTPPPAPGMSLPPLHVARDRILGDSSRSSLRDELATSLAAFDFARVGQMLAWSDFMQRAQFADLFVEFARLLMCACTRACFSLATAAAWYAGRATAVRRCSHGCSPAFTFCCACSSRQPLLLLLPHSRNSSPTRHDAG